TVSKDPTTTTISAPFGQRLVTARVNSPLGFATGKITFTDRDAVLGVATIEDNLASLHLDKWAKGEHQILAHYSGDELDEPSDSAAYEFTNYGGVNITLEVS